MLLENIDVSNITLFKKNCKICAANDLPTNDLPANEFAAERGALPYFRFRGVFILRRSSLAGYNQANTAVK
jgi:hypothetical protein